MTYVSCMKDCQVRFQITDLQRHQNIANCCVIFLMQGILTFLVGLQFFTSQDSIFSVANFPTFVARFICGIMLHIKLEPEVRQAITLIKYLNNHMDDFIGWEGPYIIAHLQGYSCVFTELINIILLCGQSDIMNTVVNFIALGAIAEIDNYYYDSLQRSPLKEFLENEPLKINNHGLEFSERSRLSKFIRGNYKILRVFYVSFYYYFTPFITPMITYLIAGAT